jgi:hypothetical protein
MNFLSRTERAGVLYAIEVMRERPRGEQAAIALAVAKNALLVACPERNQLRRLTGPIGWVGAGNYYRPERDYWDYRIGRACLYVFLRALIAADAGRPPAGLWRHARPAMRPGNG